MIGTVVLCALLALLFWAVITGRLAPASRGPALRPTGEARPPAELPRRPRPAPPRPRHRAALRLVPARRPLTAYDPTPIRFLATKDTSP